MAPTSGQGGASAKNYCVTCKTTFKHRTSLARHLRTSAAHAKPSIPCGVAGCGSLFRRHYQLEKHMRSAHGGDSDDNTSSDDGNSDVEMKNDPDEDSKEGTGSEDDDQAEDDGAAEVNKNSEDDNHPEDTGQSKDDHHSDASADRDYQAHDAFDEALHAAAEARVACAELVAKNARLEAEKVVVAAERMRVATAYADLAVENSTLSRWILEQDDVIARLTEELEAEMGKNQG
ncbi:hypothetical protein GE09DRAFT_1285503 [Coniochaeta sp. 2T2.1]|nr:hypothetical protein GE09DRAFT_1285503 [Coniochaeta sp. 2T2.1]